MKKRNRDINVFNLSMLDVIASAMGAFLIIMVILLPYYKSDYEELVEQTLRQQELIEQQQQQAQQQQAQLQQQQQQLQQQQQQLQQQQQQLQQQQQRAQDLERDNQRLRQQLANTFLIVVINWTTEAHDVDLHIVDPAGHEFYYERKTFPNVPGKLSEDTRFGPGVEVWEIQQAQPGAYQVYYRFFDKHDNPESALVTGRVYFRDGTTHFREITLQNRNDKPHVATITVQDDGQVTVR